MNNERWLQAIRTSAIKEVKYLTKGRRIGRGRKKGRKRERLRHRKKERDREREENMKVKKSD
jgi:hypothetical protein